MTFASPPIKGAIPAPDQRASADARTGPSRGPEWPRLTRREVRRIVLDILG